MMPVQDQHAVLRLVEGISGHVKMRSELRMRFDYGSIVPWVRRIGGDCLRHRRAGRARVAF